MAQRQELQEFHLTTLASLPSDMVGEVLSRAPLSRLREFQLAMPKADHSLKTILSNVWRARHKQYFPNANQESIKWLLANGESWSGIFMHDYRADKYLGDLGRKFKNSNIHDVVDCLIRNDVSGFKSLEIDWRKFYESLVTLVGASISEAFSPTFYLARLIASSSHSIRNYIYENIKSEILERPLDENHPIGSKENVDGFARALSVICGQSLDGVGDSWVDFVDDNKAAVLGRWRGTLFNFAIMIHNEKIVSTVFSAVQLFHHFDRVQESRFLNILYDGLEKVALEGCAVLSDSAIRMAVTLLYVFPLNGRSGNVSLKLAEIAGRCGHVELMNRLLKLLIKQVGETNLSGISLVAHVNSMAYSLVHVNNKAFAVVRAFPVAHSNFDHLLDRVGSLSVFEIYNEKDKISEDKMRRMDLIPKMFAAACADMHHLIHFEKYLRERQAQLSDGTKLRYDWNGNIAALCNNIAFYPRITISPRNVSSCIRLMHKVAPDNVNEEVLIDCIKGSIGGLVEDAYAYRTSLVVLRALFDYARPKFNLVTFLSSLYNASNKDRDKLLSVAFEMMGELVVAPEQAPDLLKLIGKFRTDSTVSKSLDGSRRGRLGEQLSALENKLFKMVSDSERRRYYAAITSNHMTIDSDEEELNEQEDKQPSPSPLPVLTLPDAPAMPVDVSLEQVLNEVKDAADRAREENPERKSEVDDAVVAVKEMIQSPTDQAKNDEVAEVALTLVQDSAPGMRALGIAMMVAGALMAIAGALIIAASMSAATTGILAVLAAPGVAFGVTLAVSGVAVALAGVGIFAAEKASSLEAQSDQRLSISV